MKIDHFHCITFRVSVLFVYLTVFSCSDMKRHITRRRIITASSLHCMESTNRGTPLFKTLTFWLAIPCGMILFMRVRKIAKSHYQLRVCPSVRIDQLGSHWTDSHEIWYLCIIRKYVQKIKFSLKSIKLTGTLHEDRYTFSIISRALTRTYGTQLWGCTRQSNIDIIQRFQNKVLRNMVNAPWYVRHNDLTKTWKWMLWLAKSRHLHKSMKEDSTIMRT